MDIPTFLLAALLTAYSACGWHAFRNRVFWRAADEAGERWCGCHGGRRLSCREQGSDAYRAETCRGQSRIHTIAFRQAISYPGEFLKPGLRVDSMRKFQFKSIDACFRWNIIQLQNGNTGLQSGIKLSHLIISLTCFIINHFVRDTQSMPYYPQYSSSQMLIVFDS